MSFLSGTDLVRLGEPTAHLVVEIGGVAQPCRASTYGLPGPAWITAVKRTPRSWHPVATATM
jgi:hypothetical protein